MPPRLGQHALARIEQDHREIGGRSAGHHVAGILLMPRAVGDDEAAFGGREIAIGDVDRDALLALGGEAVDQQREVDLFAARSDRLRILGERRHLVVEHLGGVVEQPPDQRRLAVIDAAAGDEAQEIGIKSSPPSSCAPSSPNCRGRSPAPARSLLVEARISAMMSARVARLALDRAGQRVAAERAEADGAFDRQLRCIPSGKRSSSTIRIMPSRTTVGRGAAK